MSSHLGKLRVVDDLIDVARGKPARQSSYSEWSRDDEAGVAVAEGFPSDFAFHTGKQASPWWEVDLLGDWPIERVVIHNRLWTMQARARRLRVEARVAGGGEPILLHAGFAQFGAAAGEGEPLVLTLGGEIKASHVRVSLDEQEYLHLSKVEVFARKDVLAVADYLSRHGLRNVLLPDVHSPYTIESDEYADLSTLVGLKVNYSGRFGNLIHQYVNTIQLAQRTGLKYIQLGSHPLLGIPGEFTSNGITFLPPDAALPSEGVFLSGEFFNSDDFLPVLEPFLHFPAEAELAFTKAVQDIVVPHILAPRLRGGNASDPHELTIHLRSGDVFGPDHPVVHGYRQPPLSFYQAIVSDMRLRGLMKVCLVYEDAGNPCVDALKAWLHTEEILVRCQSGTLAEDLAVLLSAKNLAFGHGTFGYAVSRLSQGVSNLYYFAPELGGRYASMAHVERVIRVDDRLGGYIKAYEHGKPFSPTDGWRNTPVMRDLMLTYPRDALMMTDVTDKTSNSITSLGRGA